MESWQGEAIFDLELENFHSDIQGAASLTGQVYPCDVLSAVYESKYNPKLRQQKEKKIPATLRESSDAFLSVLNPVPSVTVAFC